MQEIHPKEVWYADFPFQEDPSQVKARPVIVMDVDDEALKVLSVKVTSSEPYSEYDITLYNWAQIPLHHESTAIASSIMAIKKSNFKKKIGTLSDDDWDNVTHLVEQYYRENPFRV